MPYGEPLDGIPLWGVFLATVAAVLFSIECGFRLGRFRRGRSELEDKPPVGEMVAATLALLAFMLAFTFGLAASRFDVRRGLVIDERRFSRSLNLPISHPISSAYRPVFPGFFGL